MSRTNLSRLISPKSIAVVGNRGANFAIRESKKLGYNHKIWAIHPTLDFLEGIKCYKDIKDLPEAPDATFIAVNAESAIAIVADLKSIGIKRFLNNLIHSYTKINKLEKAKEISSLKRALER